MPPPRGGAQATRSVSPSMASGTRPSRAHAQTEVLSGRMRNDVRRHLPTRRAGGRVVHAGVRAHCRPPVPRCRRQLHPRQTGIIPGGHGAGGGERRRAARGARADAGWRFEVPTARRSTRRSPPCAPRRRAGRRGARRASRRCRSAARAHRRLAAAERITEEKRVAALRAKTGGGRPVRCGGVESGYPHPSSPAGAMARNSSVSLSDAHAAARRSACLVCTFVERERDAPSSRARPPNAANCFRLHDRLDRVVHVDLGRLGAGDRPVFFSVNDTVAT